MTGRIVATDSVSEGDRFTAPVPIVAGDVDVAALEHLAAMYRLLGGGGM
jgi:hypothetical protein